ncbi:hypothetical protein TUSST3_32550 [Streptomyces sp. TUS-ST3]|nr:hypothetical protein TUSST3_32550 [Streptomyces sp. TUS-ST3]
MSVPSSPRDLSNRLQQPWVVVIVLVLVLMVWAPIADAVSAYVDAAALVALFSAGCSTAAKYSNRVSHT